MKKLTRLFLMFVIILLPIFSFSQVWDTKNINLIYFGGEVGKSKDYDRYVNVGIWFQSHHNYFKLGVSDARDNKSEEQELLKGNYDDGTYVKTPGLADFSLTCGKTYQFLKHHHFQFGTGFSIVGKTIPDVAFNETKQPYHAERFKERVTVGLPFELRYRYEFKNRLGLAGTYKANANGLKSYANFSVGVSMGMF